MKPHDSNGKALLKKSLREFLQGKALHDTKTGKGWIRWDLKLFLEAVDYMTEQEAKDGLKKTISRLWEAWEKLPKSK